MRLQWGIAMHRAKAKENNPSGENECHPGPAFGERSDLIEGRIGGKGQPHIEWRRKKLLVRALLFVVRGGTPRGS